LPGVEISACTSKNQEVISRHPDANIASGFPGPEKYRTTLMGL
jgi:hypothetical protein